MSRTETTIVVVTDTGEFETYTGWERLGEASGIKAQSLRDAYCRKRKNLLESEKKKPIRIMGLNVVKCKDNEGHCDVKKNY